ncbi:hypothetical protein WOLCODRAFT_21409 [Wolfiporia cocos MD-104 SS10]|uniref:Uncharacterized protein n=1 Tax=Wolfiporia cocos (strain MD-104) TaxID=742152 RepID=A0A2H3JAP3_WOLCO|nr:hypothetical protein WOLCODRAFT_21409 [Wolfiporia cocos MD-104 SS10]
MVPNLLFVGKDPVIDSALLCDPDFDILGWFQAWYYDTYESPLYQPLPGKVATLGEALASGTEAILNAYGPFLDRRPYNGAEYARFTCLQREHCVEVVDHYLTCVVEFPNRLLENPKFDLSNAYANAVCQQFSEAPFLLHELEGELVGLLSLPETSVPPPVLMLYAMGTPACQAVPAIQHNAALPRDFRHLIPELAVVVVHINGQPARALLYSGSLSDFMSAKLTHQLKLRTFELEKALLVHLAMQGSRAKVNLGCQPRISYQPIDETQYFDIINLLNYDLILGTPFLFQHQIALGFNPTMVEVGSPTALPTEGKHVHVLESRAADLFEDALEHARQVLCNYAAPICKDASDSPLPPLRAINHTIPLKDELKECNGNCLKLTSPLPDMDGILQRISRYKYRSLIDGKDAYEQICVDPAHVNRMAMTTPDGNMVSTNKELLWGFLGSVGYLADDIATVCRPMGVLASLTDTNAIFQLDYTHQCTFDEVHCLVQAHRDHHHVPLNYAVVAPCIWLVTDRSHGGIAGVVAQGLVHLLQQQDLSGWQARWLEKISEFDFIIDRLESCVISVLVFVGMEAMALHPCRSMRIAECMSLPAQGRPPSVVATTGSMGEGPGTLSAIEDVLEGMPSSGGAVVKGRNAMGGQDVPPEIRVAPQQLVLPVLKKDELAPNSEFVSLLSASSDGMDLPACLRGKYPFFAGILEAPKHYKNFVVSDGLIFLRE